MTHKDFFEKVVAALKESGISKQVEIVGCWKDVSAVAAEYFVHIDQPILEGYLEPYDKLLEKRIWDIVKTIPKEDDYNIVVGVDTNKSVKRSEWGFVFHSPHYFRVDNNLSEKFIETFQTGKPICEQWGNTWFPNHTLCEVEVWLNEVGNKSHYPLQYA